MSKDTPEPSSGVAAEPAVPGDEEAAPRDPSAHRDDASQEAAPCEAPRPKSPRTPSKPARQRHQRRRSKQTLRMMLWSMQLPW